MNELQLSDLHCDTLWRCVQTPGACLHTNAFHLDISRGMKYSPWLQCFAAWIPDEFRGESAFEMFGKMRDFLYDSLEKNPDSMALIRTGKDLEKAKKDGKCAVLFTVEGGAAIGDDLNRIRVLYDAGVRMMTLTWNGANAFGGGADAPGKLTPFGKSAISLMEKLGMVVDLSHASDPLFWSVAEIARKPMMASHSNSREVCPHRRNLTDEQFCVLRDRKGLVGLNFTNSFLNKKEECASEEDILRHAEHFLALGGEDVLALGSDFDGTTVPDGIQGIQSMDALANLFLRHGYSETLVEKIFFRNVWNFFSFL